MTTRTDAGRASANNERMAMVIARTPFMKHLGMEFVDAGDGGDRDAEVLRLDRRHQRQLSIWRHWGGYLRRWARAQARQGDHLLGRARHERGGQAAGAGHRRLSDHRTRGTLSIANRATDP